MARKTKQVGRINHSSHNHPVTAHYRAICRREMIEHGTPLDLGPFEDEGEQAVEREQIIEGPKRLTRGQKAARTRALNKARAEQTEAVDGLLDLTGDKHPSTEEQSVPHRNSLGRFSRDTLDEWRRLLDSLEGATTYLGDEGAHLSAATLRVIIVGYTFEATWDGNEWTVEVVDG